MGVDQVFLLFLMVCSSFSLLVGRISVGKLLIDLSKDFFPSYFCRGWVFLHVFCIVLLFDFFAAELLCWGSW